MDFNPSTFSDFILKLKKKDILKFITRIFFMLIENYHQYLAKTILQSWKFFI